MHTRSIEILEARIAPASVFHYTDIDGDKVTLTSSVGDLNAAGITTLSGGTSGVLQLLDLHNGGFDMANLTFTVVKVAGGDGLANVGYINSTDHRLGNVIIKGDLGRVDGGLGRMSLSDPRIPALKSLTVASMGRLGTDTQTAASPSLDSTLIDGLGALTVKGDLKDVFLNITGKLGKLTIGGSFLGFIDSDNSANNRGYIACVGIGAVKIGGDLEGGIVSRDPTTGDVTIGGSLTGIFFTYYSSKAVKIAHDVSGVLGGKFGPGLGKVTIGGSVTPTGYIVGQSDVNFTSLKIAHDMAGAIFTGGTIPSLIIGGSVIGGDTVGNGALDGHLPGTGRVEAHHFGTVKIGGDIRGGSVENSGTIEGTITFTSLTIGGSLIGGTNTNTGTITGNHGFASVKIGHDLVGGSITGTDSLDSSGVIRIYDRIGSLTIGGSIISGLDASTGSLTNNATILVDNDIGALTIGGNILGHADTGTGASPVIINARGQLVPSVKGDIAIGKLTVGRTVEFARILAGYDNLTATNADAQIGPVKIGGDWVASSIVAGVTNAASSNTHFGNTDDAIAASPTVHDTPSLHSRIASITIARQIFGTPQSLSGTDHFGFVAEQIGGLKIGGAGLVIPANITPQPLGGTSDVSIHLVA